MTIPLPASKSLANRALVIQALAPAGRVTLHNVSDAQDTQTMVALLGQVADGATLDVGPAGTTFRFLTAYLCTQPGTQTLTGSARMLQRPCAPLVDALRQLGASIAYLGEEGFPPLRIRGFGESPTAAAELPGDISSQFLSALLMVGPVLPKGLTLHWTGELVSRPYLDMTVAMMRHFGAEVAVGDQQITVAAQAYSGGDYTVESDWSAASYVAARVAAGDIGEEAFCPRLFDDSLQGDRVTANIVEDWGVETTFGDGGARFRKTSHTSPGMWEYDFAKCPDLAQTFSVLCAVGGTTALFQGLQTLRIKETDRIAALRTELAKVGVTLSKLPARLLGGASGEHYLQEGKATWEGTVHVETYHDHRMAMAFALLRRLGDVSFEDEGVVGKSWPGFWGAMGSLGHEAHEGDTRRTKG